MGHLYLFCPIFKQEKTREAIGLMKNKLPFIFIILPVFTAAFLTGCIGGKEEEEMKIELNISGGAELAELEALQKTVKDQREQLDELQGKLTKAKTSGSKTSKAEIKKITEQIQAQKKVIAKTSEKVVEVKSVKGKYVWSMFRSVPSHDFYNGYNILPPLVFKWKFPAGAGFEGSPIMDGENIYVGSLDNNMYAINKSTGQLAWKTPAMGAVSCTPALYGGVLYFGSETGMFFAVNSKNGNVLWKKKLGTGVKYSSPAVYSNLVIACCDNSVYAIDRATGDDVWKFDTQLPVYASPTIANGMVYIGSADRNLYALDVESGKPVWQYQATGVIASTAAEQGGTLVVGTDDKKVHAFDSLTGALKWTGQTAGKVSSSAVIKDGVVFIGSDDKEGRAVYAFDAAAGRMLWKTVVEGKILMAAPLLVNNMLYIAAGKEIAAIDVKTGEKKWGGVYDSSIKTSLIAEDGIIYCGDADASFYALESKPQ